MQSTVLWSSPHFHAVHLIGKWNEVALIRLREELKLSVKVKESRMLEMLAAPLKAETQTIVAMENDMERMDKIIEILLGKEDKWFRNFCYVLTKNNNETWTNSLRIKAKELQKDYGKVCSTFVPCVYIVSSFR